MLISLNELNTSRVCMEVASESLPTDYLRVFLCFLSTSNRTVSVDKHMQASMHFSPTCNKYPYVSRQNWFSVSTMNVQTHCARALSKSLCFPVLLLYSRVRAESSVETRAEGDHCSCELLPTVNVPRPPSYLTVSISPPHQQRSNKTKCCCVHACVLSVERSYPRRAAFTVAGGADADRWA